MLPKCNKTISESSVAKITLINQISTRCNR